MLPDLPRLLVVVPAWNEEVTIGAVIAEITQEVPSADILVVNDGSSDGTVAAARAAGAAVLDLPLNLGVGGAMRAGFKYAQREGYDLAVQVDADGQHDPRHVHALWQTMQSEGADIVIGARFAGEGDYEVRGPRRWAMGLLALVLSRVCRTRLTDTTSGFKLMSARAIRVFASNYPAEYLGDTIEALVIAARARLTVRQVAVSMRPRAGGAPSHNPWKAAVFLLRAFFALLISLSRPSAPLPEPAGEGARA
ncbi:glycosyl transferase family 2 [Xylanimonas cellulosilytica DSM 15894]|uniref:Glycosyl transferase family 2 n=1 Tax=Xylanimonas cellulosilytica (strain DSM 15894 / JCM 12276 / CECT 5975 / KCTC 9989 / LMG 20990 / NBRC 107835 / XIL07) TaxID=446471 RepID=D1BX15_XYLCX|nr:glycosyltransferase family 2 protein [Xylanimonas cellulosilytica]ACZ31583.1 glycosyl transferase family 2 [Xylanimonas cellulosilytica DSM 15894]